MQLKIIKINIQCHTSRNGAVFIKLCWGTNSLFICLLHFAEKFQVSKTEFCEQTVFLDKTFPINMHIDVVLFLMLQHRQIVLPLMPTASI